MSDSDSESSDGMNGYESEISLDDISSSINNIINGGKKKRSSGKKKSSGKRKSSGKKSRGGAKKSSKKQSGSKKPDADLKKYQEKNEKNKTYVGIVNGKDFGNYVSASPARAAAKLSRQQHGKSEGTYTVTLRNTSIGNRSYGKVYKYKTTHTLVPIPEQLKKRYKNTSVKKLLSVKAKRIN